MKNKIYLGLTVLCMFAHQAQSQWTNENFSGNAVNFQPTTSGGSFLMNFKSNVNSTSDKGFILFQDESSNNLGSSNEDLRLTIGVYNDFRQSSSHSDELWFQGGGRLVQNVGTWDSEYASLIGSLPSGTGATSGGYEWRVNNSSKMYLNHSGNWSLGAAPLPSKAHIAGNLIMSNEIRFNNSTSMKGLIWGHTSWINYFSRIDDYNGQLRIMTDDYLYFTDINSTDGTPGSTAMFINTNSLAVAIGTTNIPSGYKLAVDGKTITEEIKVEVSGNWPDYVFSPEYDLKSLEETETFIKENNRLPDMPSAEEVAENGIELGEMNRLLLEKMEELTLHMIELQRKNKLQDLLIQQLMRKETSGNNKIEIKE